MKTITAINTEYNGYLFRSRIEARWAVFFDHVGLKYEYEKEGINLPFNGYYLPDFWLPELNIYIEVKGTYPTKIEKGKAQELAIESGCLVAILFGGIPSPDEDWWRDHFEDYEGNYMLTFVDPSRYEYDEESGCPFPEFTQSFNSKNIGHTWGYNDSFMLCDCCGGISIDNTVYNGMKNEGCKKSTPPFFKYRLNIPYESFKVARMARFEHGETPVVR